MCDLVRRVQEIERGADRSWALQKMGFTLEQNHFYECLDTEQHLYLIGRMRGISEELIRSQAGIAFSSLRLSARGDSFGIRCDAATAGDGAAARDEPVLSPHHSAERPHQMVRATRAARDGAHRQHERSGARRAHEVPRPARPPHTSGLYCTRGGCSCRTSHTYDM